MDWAVAIPFAAVIISIGTLLFTGLQLRHKSSIEEVEELRRRMIAAEKLLEECKEDRDELRLRVIELTAQVRLGARKDALA